MNNVKIHTDISVQDKYNAKTVYAPDPQIRENYEAFVQYVRELELRMRGYSKQENVIDGLIASYECYDYTNDSEGKEVLTDLTGNGHDIQLYNFAFAENSGYGLYGTNFNDWYVDTSESDVSRTSTSFTITARGSNSITSSSCRLAKNTTSFIFKFKIVRSDATNINLNIYNFLTDGSATVMETAISNVQVGQVYSYTFEDMPSDYIRRNIYFAVQEAKYIEVELVPDYKGALVSDGVDDYGLCENFPIFTKEKGYTVCAIRKLLNGSKALCFISKRKNGSAHDGAFEIERIMQNSSGILSDITYSFGQETYIKYNNDIFTFQKSNFYNSTNIKVGNQEDTDKLCLFISLYNSFTDNGSFALYALEIYDRDLTDEEIAKVKERMIKRYEEKTGETYVEEVTA